MLSFMAALAALVLMYGLEAIWSRTLMRPDVDDFRVVYCGERAIVTAHADPYLIEPLRTCEHHAKMENDEPVWSVTPFPLPGYAAAALSPLAFLPYRIARLAWIGLLSVSFCLAVVAIAGILEVSAFAVGLVFAPTLGVLNLHYGEPVLISVAALCLAALAVHGNRPRLAAIAAAVSMIEPHVGLPAALGLFVFVPEARRALVVGAAVLAALSLITMGIGTNLEYVRGFLPAQARAELLASDQFSLSRFLYVFGVAPQTALFFGSVSYAVTTLIGLLVARALVNRSSTRALFILVPVATAMLGGPFIHDVQIAAALPAALVLAQRYWTARASVALLAISWTTPVTHLLTPALAAAAGTSFIVFRKAPFERRALYAAVVTVGTLVLAFALPLTVPDFAPVTQQLPAFQDSELSSVPWGWRIRLSPAWSEDSLRTALVKIPIWVGLVFIPLSLLTLKTNAQSARHRDVTEHGPGFA
jgi:hypothetical protein